MVFQEQPDGVLQSWDMNAISFCLYGTNPKYLMGAVRNAELMPTIYPGWEMHLWFDCDVSLEVLSVLHLMHVELHEMDGRFNQRMFYRFLIHDFPSVERYLIRDADSRICVRESACVKEWIDSKMLIHTIHDHPYHTRPMLGGLWGLWKSPEFPHPNMEQLIVKTQASSTDKYGEDEDFLMSEVWPKYQNSSMQHGWTQPFPKQNQDQASFCGEIFDEHEAPNLAHRAMRHR